MKWLIPVTITLIIVAVLFTLPLDKTRKDVYFDVTIDNSILNEPKIVDVSYEVKDSTILESSYVLASFYESGDITVKTTVTGRNIETVEKNIGSLAIIETPISKDRITIHFKVSKVINPASYKVELLEDSTLIDEKGGAIT